MKDIFYAHNTLFKLSKITAANFLIFDLLHVKQQAADHLAVGVEQARVLIELFIKTPKLLADSRNTMLKIFGERAEIAFDVVSRVSFSGDLFFRYILFHINSVAKKHLVVKLPRSLLLQPKPELIF